MTQREWTDSDSDMLARLNAIRVAKDELWELAGDSEKLPPQQHGWDAGLFLVAKRFRGDPQKAQAVYFRMEALARLLMREGAPGWTLPALPDGAVPTQAAVFAAAAVEPLPRVENEIGLDRASFLDRLLSEAEVEGNA